MYTRLAVRGQPRASWQRAAGPLARLAKWKIFGKV